ncbi:MAG: histidine kinase [Chloroflexales bacterium]|nr:histidine kinase [Chloroflexales bacterium]
MPSAILSQVRHAAVATLGGQPQIVTLTIDRLLEQGVPLDALFVVHLELDNPRYLAAHRRLEQELAGERYAGLRYLPVIVRRWSQPVADLDHPESLEAARDTFDTLFRDLKQRGYCIHLCLSGGRRLLGYLGMLVAQHHFTYADRVWHLYSSDTVRARTYGGAQMHLPGSRELSLIAVPFQPLAWLAGRTGEPAHDELSPTERTRCQQVVATLSERERDVLRAFASGSDLKDVAASLCITVATVNTHKGHIYTACREAWGLADDEPRHYSWLREKFARFLGV